MELDKNLSREMINKHGVASQLDVVVEELSELIKEVIKFKRTSSHGEPFDISHLKEELADTIVMQGTILEILKENGISEEDVMKTVAEKQARTRSRYLNK
jgi:NTP pyrophosphatase (non-canonical NTP hydrolase)